MESSWSATCINAACTITVIGRHNFGYQSARKQVESKTYKEGIDTYVYKLSKSKVVTDLSDSSKYYSVTFEQL